MISIIGLIFSSCNNDANKVKLEKEYADQFEKEYTDLLNSQRWKQFSQNYAKLCDVTKMIDNADSLPVSDSSGITFNLCFVSPNEEAAHIKNLTNERQYMKNRSAQEPQIKVFSTYDNFSKDVNAILVGSLFYRNADSARLVVDEYEVHWAFLAGNKEKYIKLTQQINKSMQNTYHQFCDSRIKMDELNNCRYIVVIKTTGMVKVDVKYSDGSTGIFTTGSMKGIIYVYDLKTDKMQKAILVEAANSDNLQVNKKEGPSKGLKQNLKRNYNWALNKALKENFTISGSIPVISF